MRRSSWPCDFPGELAAQHLRPTFWHPQVVEQDLEDQLDRDRKAQRTSHFANHTMGLNGPKPAVIPRVIQTALQQDLQHSAEDVELLLPAGACGGGR